MHVWVLRDCCTGAQGTPRRVVLAGYCTQAILAECCTQAIPAQARVGHLLVQPRCVGESGVGGVLRAGQPLVIGNRSAAHKRANKRPTAKGDGAYEKQTNKQTNKQTTNQARPTKPNGHGLGRAQREEESG